MPNAPIKSPVGGRSAVELLADQNPAAYQDLLNVKHDSPVNYRDSSQKRKRPETDMLFDHSRPPTGDSQ